MEGPLSGIEIWTTVISHTWVLLPHHSVLKEWAVAGPSSVKKTELRTNWKLSWNQFIAFPLINLFSTTTFCTTPTRTPLQHTTEDEELAIASVVNGWGDEWPMIKIWLSIGSHPCVNDSPGVHPGDWGMPHHFLWLLTCWLTFQSCQCDEYMTRPSLAVERVLLVPTCWFVLGGIL